MKFLALTIPEEIKILEIEGDFKGAKKRCGQFLEKKPPEMLRKRLEYEIYRIDRMRANYPFSEKEALGRLKDDIEGFSEDDFKSLVENHELDFIKYEGKRIFERRFVDNLCFSNPAYQKKRDETKKKREESERLLHKRLDELLRGESPKAYRVRGRITKRLKGQKIPGEELRCWLPLPKSDIQQRVSSGLKTDDDHFSVSRSCHPQRTVFSTKKNHRDAEFMAEFEYRITEIVSNVNPDSIRPLKVNMNAYLKEELPHIVFTPYLKNLTEEVAGDEKNPYLAAKRIYDWITLNVKYSYMKEYKFYENLTMYAALNLHGDCGVQALLFITMCRIAKIPARWQSGWYANPVFPGNHDWAFFYVEPYGWLPVDCSFGGARRDIPEYREFYFGNLDAYRLVTASSFMAALSPDKRFIRNDPYDNQTGEMETELEPVESEHSEVIKEIIAFDEITDETEKGESQ